MRKCVFLVSSIILLATGAGCSYDASKLRAGVDADDLGQTSTGPVDSPAGGALSIGAGGFAGTRTVVSTGGSVSGVNTGPGAVLDAGRGGGLAGTGGTAGSASATARASGPALGTGGVPAIASSGDVASTGGVAARGTGGSRAASGGAAGGIDASVGGAGGAQDSSGKGGPHAEGGIGDPSKGPHSDAATGIDSGPVPIDIDGGGTDGAVTCSAPPPDFGKTCGKCGGTITCGGNCSVPTPTNYGATCVSLCLCQLTGTIDCQGNCVVKNCNC